MDDDPFIRLMNMTVAAENVSTSGDSILTAIILQIILIALNAIFACAEIAIISVNDSFLEKSAEGGNKKAKRLLSLTNNPAKFLATIQVGITAVNLLGSAFAAQNFSELLVKLLKPTGIPENILLTLSTVIITIVLLYFTVVFGELVPKRIAMRNSEKLAFSLSGLVYGVSKLFGPIVALLTASTNGILRLFGIDPNQHEEEVTEEEIRMMVDVGSQKGTIDVDEKEMIQNIFEFDDITAGDIVTHRTDVVMLWLEENDEQWLKTIKAAKHSMYPVCDETADDVIGILSTKDYFRLDDKSRQNVLNNAVRPAYFVPETVRADLLFQNMKKNRTHFAVVLDDYGGLTGIVTMNDLLEQLVGDLDDDNTIPKEEPLITPIDSTTWKVHGSITLDQLSDTLNITLPTKDYDTFGGMVFGELGTVPDDGSTPELEVFGLSVKVLEIKEHRLEKALVCLSHPLEKEKNED